jgi:hypothetical protein
MKRFRVEHDDAAAQLDALVKELEAMARPR